jgi:hypothetical protein
MKPARNAGDCMGGPLEPVLIRIKVDALLLIRRPRYAFEASASNR